MPELGAPLIGSDFITVDLINQKPELPTGCEVTSLAMLLNFHGIAADKCDLADNFLKKGPVGKTDFNSAFVGNPRDPYSYGCYAPVITECANKYLQYRGSALRAYNISGTKFEDLFTEINSGRPVLVWITMGLKAPYETASWTVKGKSITWLAGEHCVVLCGYNAENNTVRAADPLYGIKNYNMSAFKSAYNSMYSMAVTVK